MNFEDDEKKKKKKKILDELGYEIDEDSDIPIFEKPHHKKKFKK